MTTDDILKGIDDSIVDRNHVAAVVWTFRLAKTKERLTELGKHLNDERETWDKNDLDVLRKQFKLCMEKLK